MGEENGNPLHYSCLENPVIRAAFRATLHRIVQNQTRVKSLSMYALEKEMATHSIILARSIPGTEKPGGLPSMGSQRFRQDWSDLEAAAAAFILIGI